jgi:hypothetical protein
VYNPTSPFKRCCREEKERKRERERERGGDKAFSRDAGGRKKSAIPDHELKVKNIFIFTFFDNFTFLSLGNWVVLGQRKKFNLVS